jgi:hypothetical protein
MNRHYIERATATLTLLFASVIATPAFAAFDIAYYDQGMRVTGAYGFGPGGYVYLVSQGEDDASVMRRIAPDGSIDWETSFAGNSLYGSVVAANASRACVALLQGADETATEITLIVQCFAADDGATVWRADPVATDARFQRPLLYLGATNAVSVVYGIPGETGTVRLARRGSDGADEGTVALPATSYSEEATFSTDGSVLVYDSGGESVKTRIVSRDGIVKGSFEALQFPLIYSLDTIAPDGSVLLIGPQRIATIGNRTLAIKMSPTGTEIWRRVLREEESVPFPVVFGDGAAFFTIAREATPGEDFPESEAPFASIALDYATGAVRWDVDVPPARHAFFTGNVSADGNELVLVQTLLNSKVRVQIRDTATGAILGDTEYDCGLRSCSKMLTALDDDGDVRIIGRNNFENAHAVFVKNAVTPAPTPIVIDQAGLKGGWNVGTNGQGITVDLGVNAAGGTTFFAPWFAMSYRSTSESQTTTITDLHWYTLQADVPEGARELPVTIYETIGGSFATAGAVVPTRIGVGTISFTSCDEGSLAYSFDAGHNSGAQGVVGLSRLTPRTHDCVLVDEGGAITTEPVDDSREGQGGFSLDFSGTWSQVGASGQGLELAVRPGEVIAGAWFTFDRFSGDDDQHHHWFTLDGNLATATNATVTTTLYQTIGGTFDNRPALPTGTRAVGTATIHFLNCQAAELSYAFGANAGPFADISGTIQLEHLGGCDER